MLEATASLFLRLQKDPLLRPFTLIGGTALSLHLGHRLSEDLDFIYLQPRLPVELLRAFIDHLQVAGFTVERSDDPAAEDEFLIAGMELHDFSQSFVVDGAVNLTFFAADSHHLKILSPVSPDATGFSVASLPELFGLKAMVASSRSKSRDWLDLYLLLKDHGFSLDQWHEVYRQVGYSDTQFESALSRICSGQVSPSDPGFESLLPSPPAIQEIASFFREKRRVYETAMAAKVLRNDHQGG